MKESFTIKVFFRGDWCPWCNAYLKDFNDALDVIQEQGGHVIGITSQAGNQSKDNNDLKFEVIVDEENLEARKYDIFVTPKEDSPLKDVDGVYPNGMVQPGVIVEGADGKVFYRWAIVPAEMNFGGAKDRPLVSDIVAALGHILLGREVGDDFGMADMAYLETAHPDQFRIVQDYLASLQR